MKSDVKRDERLVQNLDNLGKNGKQRGKSQKNPKRYRKIEKQTMVLRNRQIGKQTDVLRYRQIDKQTDVLRDRQIHKQR